MRHTRKGLNATDFDTLNTDFFPFFYFTVKSTHYFSDVRHFN